MLSFFIFSYIIYMKGNSDLHKARQQGADEFYTSYDDISKEMLFHKGVFKDKRVFLPCDDYKRSQFFRYFKEHFQKLGLKLLVAQSICPSYWVCYDGETETVYETISGDFRSESAAFHFQLCDIVVTNPPFSLFREFMQIVNSYHKDYLVIGNVNAITYKEVFPDIVSRRCILGPSVRSGDREFLVPDEYPLEGTACRYDESTDKRYIRVKGVRWFTTLPTYEFDVKRTQLLYDIKNHNYERFDTYDALNVNTTKEIPFDYDGVLGVPITALDKMDVFSHLVFETLSGEVIYYNVIGMLNSGGRPEFFDFAKPIIDGKCKFKRILIKRI